MASEVGTLFAVSYPHDVDFEGQDEVVALDASTLTVRHKFGRGLFETHIMGLAVDDTSVYAGDASFSRHCIRVFTFTGEPVREVRGNWGRPRELQHFAGRLYIFCWALEKGSDHDVEDSDPDEEDGRIHVLTPEGEMLQVWQPQDFEVGGIDIAGDHLMARRPPPFGPHLRPQFLAVKGI